MLERSKTCACCGVMVLNNSETVETDKVPTNDNGKVKTVETLTNGNENSERQ